MVLCGVVALIAGGWSLQATGNPASPAVSSAGAKATPVNPHLVMGVETCVKCHPSEVAVWKKTPHSKTFDELHRRPEARQIAARLGVQSIKYGGRCVNCHYTQQADAQAGGDIHAIAGVSCESCHGPARHWLDVHHDYGGEHVTRQTETARHRELRIKSSVARGMRNPENVYLLAQSCYRCHTVGDEELVNVGGHNAGSLDFELVSWSQGLVRHNFVRSDGKSNDISPPARLRVMFLAGMIADLESSLRAVAVATEKKTFGLTAAKRADRAAKRLASAQAKVENPRLEQVLETYKVIQLRLNNRAQLTAAADRIAKIGYLFAKEADGDELTAIDRYIPSTQKWK